MFKEIVQTTTAVLRLAQDVQENREEIKEVRKEMRELVSIVECLRLELRQVGEREERERQMMMLQVENLLLRKRDEILALAGPAAAGEP